MQIDGHVQAIRDDLARVAAVGDESTARAAELLAVALESSLARRLQEALAEAALELTAQLESGRIEVRIAGGDPELVYVHDEESSPEPTDEAFTARITLRLPERLKVRIEAAASTEGVSVNTWLVQALQRASEPRRPVRRKPEPPHRLRPELKGAEMHDLLIHELGARRVHWRYDDPSGVPDAPPPFAGSRASASRSPARRGSARAAPRRRRPPDMAEHRFHTPGPLVLQVGIPAGDVTVDTVDGDESVVVVDGDDRLVEQTEVALEGDRLVVSFRGRKPFGITIAIGDFSIGSRRLRVRASVPHGTSARFATASGDLKVDGRLGSLEAKTASGDVRVRGEIEREATVKTVSGDVRRRPRRRRREGAERVRRRHASAGPAAPSRRSRSRATCASSRCARATRASRASPATSRSGSPRAPSSTSTRAPSRATSPPRCRSRALPARAASGPTVVLRGKTVSGDVKVVRAS